MRRCFCVCPLALNFRGCRPQINKRKDRRVAQAHGDTRLVLKEVHDRTHHHDGSCITKKPTVVELLTRFPAEAHDEMVLRDENIGQMPKHMEILRHIRRIDLTNNKLARLSDGIAEIPLLQELILQDNHLVELPKTLISLTNLQLLNVRSNRLTHLPDLMGLGSQGGGLRSLRDLNVSHNDLEILNDSIQKLSRLTVIDVRHCQLKEFPDALCDLQENLVTIYYDYNFVLKFPKPIGKLAGLRSLHLSKNELKTVPMGCIEFMTALTHLDLSHNWLEDIPQTIGVNRYIKNLILNNNHLQVAPRSLVALTSLEKLNLACNHIKRVPEITTLTRLSELCLENNCLERLPLRLWTLTNLGTLEARGNDLMKVPPVSVAYQGKQKIMQWLQEEDRRDSKARFFESRLRTVMQHFITTFDSKEALERAFQVADADGSGTITSRELDDWIRSLGIMNLSHSDGHFLFDAMDKDGSGMIEVGELVHLYDKFKHESIITEEEAEPMDEAYVKRVRQKLLDDEMNEAAQRAADEAAEAKRKFEQRRAQRKQEKEAKAVSMSAAQ